MVKILGTNRHYTRGGVVKRNPQRCWKRFIDKSEYAKDEMLWDADGGNSKVVVSRWYHSSPPKDWAIYIFSVEQAKKGYQNNKFGITKKEALMRARAYMATHCR